jgi:hypothetical protein
MVEEAYYQGNRILRTFFHNRYQSSDFSLLSASKQARTADVGCRRALTTSGAHTGERVCR